MGRYERKVAGLLRTVLCILMDATNDLRVCSKVEDDGEWLKYKKSSGFSRLHELRID